MYKKAFSFLLALVMLLSVGLFGGAAAQADNTATVAGEVSDVDAQLALIASQTEKLKQDESKINWFYTVTDLNHDGSLEFIAASLHPLDRSTNLRVWEVSKDPKTLTELSLNQEEDESFPADRTYTPDHTDDRWTKLLRINFRRI